MVKLGINYLVIIHLTSLKNHMKIKHIFSLLIGIHIVMYVHILLHHQQIIILIKQQVMQYMVETGLGKMDIILEE